MIKKLLTKSRRKEYTEPSFNIVVHKRTLLLIKKEGNGI